MHSIVVIDLARSNYTSSKPRPVCAEPPPPYFPPPGATWIAQSYAALTPGLRMVSTSRGASSSHSRGRGAGPPAPASQRSFQRRDGPPAAHAAHAAAAAEATRQLPCGRPAVVALWRWTLQCPLVTC